MSKLISRVLTAVTVLIMITVPTLAESVSASPSITEYPVPTSNASLFEITSGPDGNLWFTEQLGDQIGRITTSGIITEFPVPTAVRVGSITTGPDGNLWFTFTGNNNNNGGIGEITTSGVITEFPLPVYGVSIGGITTGPDGNLWFTESQNRISDMIGEITTSGNVTQYPITPYTGDSGSLGGIVTGSDGALWFTMTQDDQIGRITTSGAINVYQVPTASAFPFGITSGPDGNLWFTEQNGDKIGQITTSGNITEFLIPTSLSNPADIVTGPDGNLWFTEVSANQIGQITTLGSVTEYPTPTANSNPYGIAVGPDGALWFTENNANNIGQLVISSPPTFTSNNSVVINARDPLNFTVTTTGNPVPSIMESGSLPTGITFTDNGDGTATLSGQASTTNQGYYFLTFTTSNSAGTATQSFLLTTTDYASVPTFLNANSLTESLNQPFSFTIDTTGVPIPNITKTGSLPKGVTYKDNNDGTATLSGEVTKSSDIGTYDFTIKAKNHSGTATQDFALTIE